MHHTRRLKKKGGDSAHMDDPSHIQMTFRLQDGRVIPAFLAAGLRGPYNT